MLENISIYGYIFFIVALVLSIVFFYAASHQNKRLLWGMMIWIVIQSVLGLIGFFENTGGIPSRTLLLLAPVLLILIGTLFSKGIRSFMHQLDLRQLTFLHSIRIPVEFVLYWVFLLGYVPKAVTFEGSNFDILSGITAIIVGFIAFKGGMVQYRKLLLVWNIFALLLLINVVATAVLSIPTEFQQLNFDQPNIAVLYFPFNLLPAFIVPLVFWSHLAAIIQLLKRN